MRKKKILGILTGGGPAPGLNAVIYGAAGAALRAGGWEILGVCKGWRGILTGEIMPLTAKRITGIANKSGTVIQTSRTNLHKVKTADNNYEDKSQEAVNFFKAHELTGLLAIGGEDTISVAHHLFEAYNLPIVCAPKTIDGDVCGTDRTFGLDTASNWVANAIRGIHEDFASTGYVAVVEIMGRNAGWLSLFGGIAGGAHVILIPELTYEVENIVLQVKKAYDQFGYCLVAAAEELKIPELEHHLQEGREADAFGHKQIALRERSWAKVIAEEITERSGLTARAIILGHAQRGGPPSALDVYMGLLMGYKAFEVIQAGEFGKLIAWRREKPIPINLAEAGGGKIRTVPPEIYQPLLANLFP